MVWLSGDPVSVWTAGAVDPVPVPVPVLAPFSPRSSFAVVSHNRSLLVLAGRVSGCCTASLPVVRLTGLTPLRAVRYWSRG